MLCVVATTRLQEATDPDVEATHALLAEFLKRGQMAIELYPPLSLIFRSKLRKRMLVTIYALSRTCHIFISLRTYPTYYTLSIWIAQSLTRHTRLWDWSLKTAKLRPNESLRYRPQMRWEIYVWLSSWARHYGSVYGLLP